MVALKVPSSCSPALRDKAAGKTYICRWRHPGGCRCCLGATRQLGADSAAHYNPRRS
jgi:hypothetical protein